MQTRHEEAQAEGWQEVNSITFDTFANELLKRLRKERDGVKEHIAAGNLASIEQYRLQCGIRDGLDRSIAITQTLLKNAERIEDE